MLHDHSPGARLAAPVAMLAPLAEVVRSDLAGRVRTALVGAIPVNLDASPCRIAGYLEDGLSLLTSHRFDLAGETGFSMDLIEACRQLAEREPRFRFIYRLPSSAGWGAAIGEAVERALFGTTCDNVRTVTALLNTFMTLLDGLLDEAPEVVAPHRRSLLDLVRSGSSGTDVSPFGLPGDHPYNDMCFLIARLWIRRINALSSSNAVRGEFVDATTRAMLAEFAASDARFDRGVPDSVEPLYGRTRWPLWTQTLVVACRRPWPEGLDVHAFRELILEIGDYAAYLDDVSDYIADCLAGRWNTLSWEAYSRRPFAFSSPEEIQSRLLANLADEGFANCVVRSGVDRYNAIEESLDLPGVEADGLRALIADLAYGYLY
jgi:hypothetical protein